MFFETIITLVNYIDYITNLFQNMNKYGFIFNFWNTEIEFIELSEIYCLQEPIFAVE